MDRNYYVITFFENTFILRRPRVVNFADIIKIATIIIKTTFKDSKKVKELETMISGEKILMSAELKGYVT